MNEREKVAWILRDIRTLPTLPHVAVELLRQSERAETSLSEIALLVEKDPSIATRLLKLVNSSYFGLRREVASVHQALMLVGLNNLRSLVLSTSVMDLFDQKGQVGQLDRGDLWKHCIATAITARAIAKDTRMMDPEVAFTAGLIHDIGKVIVDRYLHPEFVEIVALMEQQSCTMRQAEGEILGVTHPEIGLHLTTHWNLPEVLRECVAYHHSPNDAGTYGTEAAVIALANEMSYELGHGYGEAERPLESDQIRALTRLSEERAAALRGQLLETIESDVSAVAQHSSDHAH
ncbi:HDOD domain-containing protein [candidate division KSB1 bacterium]|nr:HDOD domain-containing protein [candidate division KSB1 bacterium]